MSEPALGKEIHHAAGGTGRRIARAEHDACDAGVQDGARAHGAGLDCNI